MFADEFFRAEITLYVLAVTSSCGKKEVVPHFKMEMRSVTAICVADLTDLFSFSDFISLQNIHLRKMRIEGIDPLPVRKPVCKNENVSPPRSRVTGKLYDSVRDRIHGISVVVSTDRVPIFSEMKILSKGLKIVITFCVRCPDGKIESVGNKFGMFVEECFRFFEAQFFLKRNVLGL